MFGNWLSGAAFALVLTNGPKLLVGFTSLTAFASDNAGASGSNDAYQAAVGAWMVLFFVLGVVVGFTVMANNGRRLLDGAAQAGGGQHDTAQGAPP